MPLLTLPSHTPFKNDRSQIIKKIIINTSYFSLKKVRGKTSDTKK